LTEYDDVITTLLRGAMRLGLALGPAPSRTGPAASSICWRSYKTHHVVIYSKLVEVHAKKVNWVGTRKFVSCWMFLWKFAPKVYSSILGKCQILWRQYLAIYGEVSIAKRNKVISHM